MTHHLARQMEQTPAHGGHLVAQPAGVQGGMLEQDEQIVGDDADTEEGSIGLELSAGHPRALASPAPIATSASTIS